MTASTRQSVWIALGQVALVLLSVGLGVALGEWRQSRADSDRAEQAMASVVREIATNQREVSQALDYHRELIVGLEDGTETGVRLQPAFLVDNAWETAQSAGVVADLPYGVVERLSQTHELQAIYQDLARLNLGLLYFGNVFSSDRLPSDVRGYASSVSDLMYFETGLLASYAEALAALSDDGFSVPDSLMGQ